MPIGPFEQRSNVQWKFYVLFWSQNTNEIIFPIKKTHNAFDGSRQFAGGYPAFFGGNLQVNNVLTTLINEVEEESCETYSIQGNNNDDFDFLIPGINIRGNGDFDKMHFYTTKIFRRTDVDWPNYQYPDHKAPRRDYGEMDTIFTVNIDNFRGMNWTTPPDDILRELISICGDHQGCDHQYLQFMDSETGRAFVQFIQSKISPRNRVNQVNI